MTARTRNGWASGHDARHDDDRDDDGTRARCGRKSASTRDSGTARRRAGRGHGGPSGPPVGPARSGRRRWIAPPEPCQPPAPALLGDVREGVPNEPNTAPGLAFPQSTGRGRPTVLRGRPRRPRQRVAPALATAAPRDGSRDSRRTTRGLWRRRLARGIRPVLTCGSPPVTDVVDALEERGLLEPPDPTGGPRCWRSRHPAAHSPPRSTPDTRPALRARPRGAAPHPYLDGRWNSTRPPRQR